MNKISILENAKRKFNGELLDIVLNQIDDYFKLANSNYKVKNNYQINDKVLLNENHLLHGIGKHVDIINVFAERGIVSQDYFEDASDHAFCYESAFWNVKGNISLEEYIKNYSGIVAKVNNKYWQVPYGRLDEFVEKMKEVEHWLWTAESSMEIRFMPSLARNINQIGFILNTENEIAQRLKKNSVFKEPFNKDYAMQFVNDMAKEKFMTDGFTADFFERADYIIFGLPKNCIEGIIVGRQVEHNENHLETLKTLFPNSYICNLDGVVIR